MSINCQMDKLWHIQTMEYNSVMNRKTTLIHHEFIPNESQKQYAKQKNPDRKHYMLMIPFINVRKGKL